MAVPVMAADASPGEFFESRIRPVLVKNCHSCHGPAKMSGLDMTSRAGLEKGGTRGPALAAGDPERSLLVRAIRHEDEKLRMPPAGRLSDAEIADLSAWVKAGAVWPEARAAAAAAPGYRISPEHRQWWAFQPVRKPVAPIVRKTEWVKTPIDRFVLNKLEEKGLKPVAAADRRALIRRVYFDLIGLPPPPEEVEAFEKDKDPAAYSRLVDQLLRSRHYGERWGRYWLDVARYSDDRLNSTQDDPYPNAWRYRDWVIEAFNNDMPFDLFVKAQIAGDLLDHPQKDKLVAGLGFYALSPEFQDDRVDATSRGFLALTVACAQCHDHKFDPIPTKDYYALQGVFSSTRLSEFPLAPEAAVKDYKQRQERIEEQQKEIDEFLDKQANQLAAILATGTARYLEAAKAGVAGRPEDLDKETLDRWVTYLGSKREHPFLDGWDKEGFSAQAFQKQVLDLIKEKARVDETNFIRLGGSQKRGDLAGADLLSLPRDQYFLWRDLLGKDRVGKLESGIFYYKDGKIDRFLEGPWKRHLAALRGELDKRKKELPEQYPFMHTIADVEKPHNVRIRIRGSAENLGAEAQRAFLSILSSGEPVAFRKGSGRLELAEAIASPDNPLTARVMVNRVWKQHFGEGLVETPSNFGQLGGKPSHPELLDYLAARLVEEKWSLKALHREILLSAAYQLAAVHDGKNAEVDGDNRLLWRANRRRLDIEPLRDALLAASGELDQTAGGKPEKLTEEKNKRRTVYGFVSRRKLDGTLALFDFPNPNASSEQRIETATPLQALFFLNSDFLQARAKAFAARLEQMGGDDAVRIRNAYRILFGRLPAQKEVDAGLLYLKETAENGWPLYAQALLSSNELLFVN